MPTATPMVQMMVTVPDGVMSGQQMQVNGPDGQAMIVTVPEGVDAGGQFGVMVRSRRMPPTRLCSHMHCTHRHSAVETRMSSVRPGLACGIRPYPCSSAPPLHWV